MWETFFFHYHSFNRFLKCFTTDFFLHFNACILPTIIRHTVEAGRVQIRRKGLSARFLIRNKAQSPRILAQVAQFVSHWKTVSDGSALDRSGGYTRYDTGYGFSWFDPDLVIAHWITMNMPYPVPYPIWKCLPYGSTHPL